MSTTNRTLTGLGLNLGVLGERLATDPPVCCYTWNDLARINRVVSFYVKERERARRITAFAHFLTCQQNVDMDKCRAVNVSHEGAAQPLTPQREIRMKYIKDSIRTAQ